MVFAWILPIVLGLNAVALYYLLNGIPDYGELPEHKKHEFLARVNGLLFIVYLVIRRVFTHDPHDVMEQLTQIVGYMVYDCAHLTYYAKSMDYYIHHLFYFSCYFIGVPFASETNVKLFYDLTCMLESTGPFMTVAWMLDALNYPAGQVQTSAQILAFVTWTLIRMVLFPYWIMTVVPQSYMLYPLSFMVLNCYWFYLLVKKVMKVTKSTS
jgi:hypothetical protein